MVHLIAFSSRRINSSSDRHTPPTSPFCLIGSAPVTYYPSFTPDLEGKENTPYYQSPIVHRLDDEAVSHTPPTSSARVRYQNTRSPILCCVDCESSPPKKIPCPVAVLWLSFLLFSLLGPLCLSCCSFCCLFFVLFAFLLLVFCFFCGSLLVRSLLLSRVLFCLFVLLSFFVSFCLVVCLSPSSLPWHNYRRKFWLEALQDNPQISSPARLWIHLQVTLHYFTRRNTEFGRSYFR